MSLQSLWPPNSSSFPADDLVLLGHHWAPSPACNALWLLGHHTHPRFSSAPFLPAERKRRPSPQMPGRHTCLWGQRVAEEGKMPAAEALESEDPGTVSAALGPSWTTAQIPSPLWATISSFVIKDYHGLAVKDSIITKSSSAFSTSKGKVNWIDGLLLPFSIFFSTFKT